MKKKTVKNILTGTIMTIMDSFNAPHTKSIDILFTNEKLLARRIHIQVLKNKCAKYLRVGSNISVTYTGKYNVDEDTCCHWIGSYAIYSVKRVK